MLSCESKRCENNCEKGIVVNSGIVTSSVTIIENEEDISKMIKGNILVVKNSRPEYAEALLKASGLVCEIGGRLTHLCIVALEMGIPCITQVKIIDKINEGDIILLDGNAGVIYY